MDISSISQIMRTYVPADSDNPSAEDEDENSARKTKKKPCSDPPTTPQRGGWSNQLDFLFSCISVSVGLGNVWRFPYLCYKNGGGAFLVTYHIAMLVCGVPMFLQEVAIGQYLGSGGMTLVATICPILRGAGYASMTIVFLLDVYYCVIVAWTLFYLGGSISSLWQQSLPWESCDNWWNTENCGLSNRTSSNVSSLGTGSPAEEYWSRRVLQVTEDIKHMGSFRWELFAYLILAWVIVFGVLRKGLHASGKVVWFTALFPCFMLAILLIRAVTLKGAANGLRALFSTDWEGLLNPRTWIDGATQIFFGYSIGVGTLPALGSYNRFHHNCYRDAVITCVVNTLTSLVAAVITFSSLGFLAESQGVDVAEVVSSGPGLVFVTYPEVLLQLPCASVWAIIFFFMLLILGVDSEFCNVESFLTGALDRWPRLQNHRMAFGLTVCSIMCALAIPMLNQGGLFVFQLMDNYAASGLPLLWVAFFQTAAISWAFGTERFSDCVEKMTGVRPGLLWRLCWGFFAPACMAGIFIFFAVRYEPTRPRWAEVLGLSISAASMLWIPVCAVWYIMTSEGTLKEILKSGVTPLVDPNHRRRSAVRRPTLLLEHPVATALCESKVTLV